jgi:NADPH2:quinone reductase
VVGTASTDAKRSFALEMGVQELVEGHPDTLPSQVMKVTAGRGVDLAFDHVGGALFIACLRSLAPSGMAVSYNIVGGPPDGDVFAEMRKLLARSLAIRTFSIHAIDSDVAMRRGLMTTAIDLMAKRRVRAPKATIFKLDQARAVHELLDSGASLGKVVLQP